MQYHPEQRAGLVLFWFDELYRSTVGVTMRDPVRGIYLRFNLTTSQVLFRWETDAAFEHLYGIASAVTLDASYAVYKQIAEQYAPIMWLASGEEWFPSSVSFFQTKVRSRHMYIMKLALIDL